VGNEIIFLNQAQLYIMIMKTTLTACNPATLVASGYRHILGLKLTHTAAGSTCSHPSLLSFCHVLPLTNQHHTHSHHTHNYLLPPLFPPPVTGTPLPSKCGNCGNN